MENGTTKIFLPRRSKRPWVIDGVAAFKDRNDGVIVDVVVQPEKRESGTAVDKGSNHISVSTILDLNKRQSKYLSSERFESI